MMKDFIFIHIPKTGGISIQRVLGIRGCSHRRIDSFSKEDRDSSFTFAIVRNPFDRIVSAYNYLKSGGTNEGDKLMGDSLPSDFRSFVKDIDQHINFLHFRPMSYWLNDDVDFIGKFENLQEDFDSICRALDVECKQLPHVNKSKYKNYVDYYDDNTRQIVADKYAEDITRFDYKF